MKGPFLGMADAGRLAELVTPAGRGLVTVPFGAGSAPGWRPPPHWLVPHRPVLYRRTAVVLAAGGFAVIGVACWWSAWRSRST